MACFSYLGGRRKHLGALYFESLAFVLVRTLPDYAPLLRLPGLQAALALAAGLAATWIVLEEPDEELQDHHGAAEGERDRQPISFEAAGL